MPIYGSEIPVGAGMLWYTDTAPNGWLIADGSSVARATYPNLFAVIGTTYGSVDANSFNLPDLRQRFPLGKAASGTGNTLAGTGGAIDHTHSVPAHYHGMGTGADLNITSSGTHTTAISHDHASFNTATAGGHGHSFSLTASSNTFAAQSNSVAGAGRVMCGTNTTGTEVARGDHTHSVTGTVGGSDGTHLHAIDVPAFTGNSSSDGAHTHASSAISGSIGLVTGGVNGNAAMTSGTQNPPYLVVNYIIKFV